MDKNFTVNITLGTFFKGILILLLFATLFYLRDIVLIVLTSVIIASSIEPMTKWIMKYKAPRVLAVVIVYVVSIAILIGLFYAFVPPILDEAAGLMKTLPQFIESTDIPSSITAFLPAGFDLNELSQKIPISELINNVKDLIVGTSGGFFSALSAISGGAFSFILIIVLSFYLAVQENGITNFLRIVTPSNKEEYIIGLWKRTQTKIGKWMQGQLLLALIIGVLVYLGMTIIGIKYALLLALLAALAELIPVFGPILAAVPAVILGFMESFGIGSFVFAFYIIVQQFENHLIYPLVVRKVVGVSPILVILALIIGAKLAGFLGILLAVPIAAALLEFVKDVDEKKHGIKTTA